MSLCQIAAAVLVILCEISAAIDSQGHCPLNIPKTMEVVIFKTSDSGGWIAESGPENVTFLEVKSSRLASFTCKDSYTLIGNPLLKCNVHNGHAQWSGVIPECKFHDCPWHSDATKELEFRYNGILLASNSGGFPIGTELKGSAKIDCELGFVEKPGSTTIYCTARIWSKANSSCVPAPDSCKWNGEESDHIEVLYKGQSLILKSSDRFPAGSEVTEYDNVKFLWSFTFKGKSRKVCYKGNWTFLGYPCDVSVGMVTGLFTWGVITTLLCAVFIGLKLKYTYCSSGRISHSSPESGRSKNDHLLEIRNHQHIYEEPITIYSDVSTFDCRGERND